MIVADEDDFFSGMFNKNFQEILLIPVHTVARGNHKSIINEGFHRYLNKAQKINQHTRESFINGCKAYYL